MAETQTRPDDDTETPDGPERIEDEIIRRARSNHQQFPVLEVIFDRFALSLGPALKSQFAGATADAELQSFKYMTCGEALERLSVNGLAAVTEAQPWDGYFAMVLNPDMVFTALEIMLGGRTATRTKWTPRAYSAIEKKFARRLCELVLTELRQAFAQLCDVEFGIDRIEGSPQALVLAPPASPCVSITMRIEMEERSGTVTFLMPNSSFEAIQPLLSQPFRGGQLGGDSSWRALLGDSLKGTGVTLDAVLHEPRLNLQDVLEWKKGHTIELGIDTGHEVTVTCSGMKMFSAAMGRRRNGSVALRVTHDFSEKDDPDVSVD